MPEPLPYRSPPFPANVPPAAPALTPEHMAQLAEGRRAGKKIRRIVAVARGDAWMIAIFAVLSGLSIFFSLVGGLLGVAMGVIAYVEFSGAAGVKRLDPQAARKLGWNQLAFAALIIAYCLYSLHDTFNGGELAKALKDNPELEQAIGGDMQSLSRTLGIAVYGTLIAVAVLAQGGLALYYFSREKVIRAYAEATPGWVVEMLA